MCILFGKGMTGGLCYISKRYSKGSNKYLKSYDPKQESEHTLYLDPNILHGHAISKFLPTSISKWIDPKDLAARVKNDVFYELILNILKNNVNYIIIISSSRYNRNQKRNVI